MNSTVLNKEKEIFSGDLVQELGLDYENMVVKAINKTGYMRNFLCEIAEKFLKQEFKDTDAVLEIGFGIGAALKVMVDRGIRDIVAVDAEAKHLDIAKNLLKQTLNDHPDAKLTFICDTIPHLTKLKDCKFRSILCAETLHFMKPDEFPVALKRLYDLLEPKGSLYITIGSPYVDVYKGFAEEYDALRKQGVRYPGFMENVRKYHPNGINHNLGFFLFFDPVVLAERVSEAGFKVKESDYVDVKKNNKGLTGLIAQK